VSPTPSPAPALEPKRRLRDRVLGCFGRSLTIAWAYLMIASGLALDALPLVSDILNAPEIQAVVTGAAGPYASHWLKAIGLITALARIRSLRKGA
jgi:hypothetical protein